MLTALHDSGLSDDARHLSLPACPYARHGSGSAQMLACSGFQPDTLSFAGLGAGESLGDRVTCAHLTTQRGVRGFVSACKHPGGVPPA